MMDYRSIENRGMNDRESLIESMKVKETEDIVLTVILRVFFWTPIIMLLAYLSII
jgi:hypothetical protein